MFARPWSNTTLAVLALGCASPAAADTFVVDTTSDSPALSTCSAAPADCSLRGAITRANTAADADEIQFAIPSDDPGCDADAICRIEVGTTLPVSQPLTIDGYSQPGAQANTLPAPGANNAQLRIEITSAGFINLGTGLFNITGSGSPFSLRGLAMALPASAIVTGGQRHEYVGNWFCVDARGQSPDFNPACSAFGLGSFNRSIRIGGPNPADRNVIAGGGRDLDGQPAGGTNTIRVNSSSTERGLILLQGNLIGLAPDGITPLPMRDPLLVNTGDDTFDTPDIRILDNRFARAPRNLSGGFGGALRLSISRTMNDLALVQGNVFGLGTDGSVVGVEKDHIEVFLGNNSRVPRLLIGGLGANQGNTFAGALRQSFTGLSLGSAVILPNGNVSTFVEFVGNRMLGNAGIGVDFPTGTAGGGVALGRTLNDPDDADIGANLQQNFPQILEYSVGGDNFTVRYLVDSAPANTSYPLRVDFYKALGDEGLALLDSDVYALAEAQLDKQVSLMIPPGVSLGPDDVLVAIATDADGRSSEFSFDTLVLGVVDTPDPAPAGLPFEVEVTATATSGPFKPNGIVQVSMNTTPSISCEIALAPSATPSTGSGSCNLTPLLAGNFTITARYLTLQGAFASASGADVVVTEPHAVNTAPLEQIGFSRCRQNITDGQIATIAIERPSGGFTTVNVDFSHEVGTATPGDDYIVPTDRLLQWAPGDLAPKLIDVAIASDSLVEPVERFRVHLADPIGAVISPFAQLDVDIIDASADLIFGDGFEGLACLP